MVKITEEELAYSQMEKNMLVNGKMEDNMAVALEHF